MRFPPKSPMPAAVATVPSAKRSFLNVNAAKNWRKPIAPRRIAMADPASRIEGWCSSVRSSSASTGAWVRRTRGIRVANTAAMRKITIAMRSDQSAPKSCCTASAGAPPTTAAVALMSARREFAFTNDDSSSTRLGTSELRATE